MDQKHKAMKRVKISEDRISGLPDPILGHILSYLTTKESVRTSILSKRCGVKELDICITETQNFELPVPLFVYQDLVSLKLCCEFVLDIPGEVLLPCLKKLYLKCIDISDDESCRKLLSGCPVLEYLHMIECDMSNVKTLQIIAPALKCLVFDSQNGSLIDFRKLHVFVDAPFLEVLRWECISLAKSYNFKNLGPLTDAYIDLFVDDYEYKTSFIRKSSLQLIKGIAHAKTITFTDNTVKVLSFLDANNLPLFNNLTKLVLGGYKSRSTLLPKFLANSPFLQDLVLDLGHALHNPLWDFEWHDPIQVPQCLLDSLVSVEIKGFNGQSNMLKFIKYLLSNAKVLDKLSADRDKEEHEELKVSKELLSLLLE